MFGRLATRRSLACGVSRWISLSAPAALLLGLVFIGTAAGSSAREASHAAPLAANPRSPVVADCTIAQVRFSYFGEDGAAGTAVTEFDATDASARACVLAGYPTVRFFAGSIVNGRAMPVQITHTGAGVAFSPGPKRVLLQPGAATTPDAAGAEFVITSADFAPDGSGTCPEVTSLEIRLTATGDHTRVPLWYLANICRGASSVSSFFSAGPDTYTTPALPPICASSELAITASPDGAGLSHVGLILHFRNFGLIPCRISGYPSVVLVAATGSRNLIAAEKPFGYLGGLTPGTGLPPLVALEPGQLASSLLEGVDFDNRTERACPRFASLLVAPPGVSESVRVTTSFDGCSDLEIQPVLSGTTGRGN
jgi:hypothetical protein